MNRIGWKELFLDNPKCDENDPLCTTVRSKSPTRRCNADTPKNSLYMDGVITDLMTAFKSSICHSKPSTYSVPLFSTARYVLQNSSFVVCMAVKTKSFVLVKDSQCSTLIKSPVTQDHYREVHLDETSACGHKSEFHDVVQGIYYENVGLADTYRAIGIICISGLHSIVRVTVVSDQKKPSGKIQSGLKPVLMNHFQGP